MAPSVFAESFPFNDCQDLIQRTWKVYKSLSSCPEELRDLQDAIISVVGSLRLVFEYSRDHLPPASNLSGNLQDQLKSVDAVILRVEEGLQALKERRLNVGDLAKNLRKLVVQGARLSAFYEVLTSDSHAQIIQTLKTLESNSSSILQSQNWSAIAAGLTDAGLSREVVEENYFVINNWLQNQPGQRQSALVISTRTPTERSQSIDSRASSDIPHRNGASIRPQASPTSSTGPRIPLRGGSPVEDEELPDYTAGTRPKTTVEKSRNLERAEAILSAEDALGAPSSSSAVDPPAYTFDGGDDNEMDEEFSRYIQQAIVFELRRRYQAREVRPKEGAKVYAWLPAEMHRSFAGREEVVSLMDAKSFTAMAYETTPRVIEDLESILPILRMSADGTGDDYVFATATNTIRVMVKALSKFTTVQHSMNGESFSDLDALDYEYDTAQAVDSKLSFPDGPFDVVQKSFYNLLTYIMGMTDLLKDIFAGQPLVLRTREDLSDLWHQRRMDARTAWILKQLAGWSSVDEAIQVCRDWRSLRPVRNQAIAALQRYQESVGMLLSNVPPTTLHIKLISASGLTKSHNYQVQCTMYADQRLQKPFWSTRFFSGESAVIKNTQNPVFNYEVDIPLPDRPTMVDLRLVDLSYRGREVGRVRMKFLDEPGIERTLDGKDLLYGFDEELSTPVPISEASKGKELETPMLHYRLAWKGRYQLVEEAGLPLAPPGKMFRPNRGHVPMPFPNQAELSAAAAGRLSSASARSGGNSQVGESSMTREDTRAARLYL